MRFFGDSGFLGKRMQVGSGCVKMSWEVEDGHVGSWRRP